MNCDSALKVTSLNSSYSFRTIDLSKANMVIVESSAFSSTDLRCEIQTVTLMQGSNSYAGGCLVTTDKLGTTRFNQRACEETGLFFNVALTGGAIAKSAIFDVSVTSVQCDQMIGVTNVKNNKIIVSEASHAQF